MKPLKNTKKVIIESALYLFHLKGFHGTSIRDIANKANINPANISYYFKSKQGLLEYCFITYLEEYTHLIEKEVKQLDDIGPRQCLLRIIKKILYFNSENFLAARFILREMALDSNLNREVLSTYLAKEKYLFELVIKKGIQAKNFKKVSISSLILQLKGLITSPVFNAHYSIEVLHSFPQEKYFLEQYNDQLALFISSYLWEEAKSSKMMN
ncbi:forespore capture DNA-binding protein RefZ [Peribacillus tepidiphilus]|uniref:forespore capture DNA-binding protein RefZ n=1 Tax=Peribacillus tepidiphilus TaxID=2652445 RepID=UPI0035B569F7